MQASAAATAPFAGVTHAGASGTTSAGSGSLLAVPPGYQRHIHTFPLSSRARLGPAQIVLDQQLAATLQARIGDTVTLDAAAGRPPRAFRVSGVALITAPDVVFQPLNPLLGPAPAPAAGERRDHAAGHVRRARSRRSCHRSRPAPSGASAVPGAQSGVQWQVQAQVDPAGLGHTPGQALHPRAVRSSTASSARCPARSSSSTTSPTS